MYGNKTSDLTLACVLTENYFSFDVVCYSGGESWVYTFEAQAAQSAEEVKLWTADIGKLIIPDVTNAAMTNGPLSSGN